MNSPEENYDYDDELAFAGEPYSLGVDEDGCEIYSQEFYNTEAGEEMMYQQMLMDRDD